MKYINTKTQAVIDTACVIKGGNWEPADKQPKDAKAPRRTARSAKTAEKSGE